MLMRHWTSIFSRGTKGFTIRYLVQTLSKWICVWGFTYPHHLEKYPLNPRSIMPLRHPHSIFQFAIFVFSQPSCQHIWWASDISFSPTTTSTRFRNGLVISHSSNISTSVSTIWATYHHGLAISHPSKNLTSFLIIFRTLLPSSYFNYCPICILIM